MPASDVRRRLDTLFPRLEDVPAAADFASGGGDYPDGTLYLVDGELRRWSGDHGRGDARPCACERDGRVERRRMGAHASLTKEEALAALDAAVRAWDDGRGALADDERRRPRRRRARGVPRAPWSRSARNPCAC